MQIIQPPKLQAGDKVGIVSPANSIKTRLDTFRKAKKEFEKAFDVEIEAAPHALGRYYYTSGKIEERVADVEDMISNQNIRALIFSVGGNTTIDLVDRLDYNLIKSNPKIISGISDATTLLNSVFAKTGLITFHGIEFLDFGREAMEYTKESIRKAWFEGEVGEYHPNNNWRDFRKNPTEYKGWRIIRGGRAPGRIIGGNLSSFYQLIGTKYFPKADGNILVLETYKQPKKKIHQGLAQLRLQGVLNRVSGMIVGYLTGSDDPNVEGNERDIRDLILEVTSEYDFPVMQVGEIGHLAENLVLPIGARATMDADNRRFVVNERVCC